MAVPVLVVLVVAGVLGFVAVRSRTSAPSPSPAPKTRAPSEAAPDCADATHPPQGSAERRQILDALRAHYGYEGLYTVQFVTLLGDWAYIEASPVGTETFRGYLTQRESGRWAWRWEGATGASADGGGYPPEFTGGARDVLRCG